VVVGRDITEQRREALGRQLRDRLAQASLRGDALEAALGPVMHHMADHLGLRWIAMLRVDGQGVPMDLAQGGALRFDRETATALVLAPAEPPLRVVCPIVYQGEEYGRLVYRPAADAALSADARQWLERVASEVGAACQLDAAQDRLRFMAHYDSLTGLPNRSLFLHQLRQAMASAAEGDCLHALLFLDLDRFKHVNDSLGHAAGDQLLKEVGLRLRQVVRGRDIVARLSGDEYAILLHRAAGMQEIENTLARVLAVLRTPIRLGTDQISTRGSIGLTLLPLDDSDAAGLVRHADLAMYEAKRAGRDRWSLFEPRLDSETLERHDLEQRLRQALAEDRFILHFQPQIDLRSGRVVGVEALLRWADPTALPRSPEVFVPVAEETGLIIPLGEWVLREACAQQQRWMQEGLTLQVAVNLSPMQFLDPELHRRVEEALAAGGAAAEYIALEITERAAFADPRRARAILDGWRADGMQCAIDDFGTGQASLSYLTDLPAEVIKIDRAFIAPLPRDVQHCAIVEGVIHMGHQLGRKVLAEGVETAEQLAWLRDQGCDLAQGFTIAEPMPAEALVGWVQAWDARRPLSLQPSLPYLARSS
ncbi:MAG TPA: EAL domain-containing protein, partial [Acidiferrobacteraceae bacterium]|nr:EAL domain-containing protein [Acidiferrobacteraceae bacterium]